MNKSKVIITALISVLSVFSFVSCGEDTESSSAMETNSSPTVESSAENSKSEVTTSVNDNDVSSESDEYSKETVDIDCHYELSKIFEDSKTNLDYLYAYRQPIIDPEKDTMCFFAVPGVCNDDYSNLTIDINAPDTWLSTVKDVLTNGLGHCLEYAMLKPSLTIESEEQVEISGRTFIKFTGSFHDDREDKDVTAVGYLTVIKGDPNLSEYKEDNTVGFITTDYSENADLEVLDGHSRHAAETLTIGD